METKEQKELQESIRDKVLAEWKKGNVCFMTCNGIYTRKFEDFTKQPLEGMLYDINRNSATVITCLDDPKWVNDFALTKLLEYYYDRCKELEKKLEDYENIKNKKNGN